VIQKLVEEGTVITSATQGVSGGTILLQMANLDTVQVRALVDETDIGKIKPGLDVTIIVDAYKSRPFDGRVLKIEPQSTVAQNVTMFPVLVRIPNDESLLKPGMNVEVEFHVGARQGVVAVPNAALRTSQDVESAAQVLGMDFEVVQQQIAEAQQGGGGEADESEAGGGGRTASFRGRSFELPEGIDVEKARALFKKLENGDMRSLMSGGLSSDEQALMRQLMPLFRGQGGGPGGRQETSGTDAALAGGDYIVFVLRDGVPQAVPIRTGLTDLDYSEVASGIAVSDTVLILPSASLIASQQQWQERMSRFGRGGLPGISRN
jgi:HlyD family secretion protein